MPLRSSQYTLVGFSDVFDWRPLHFVRPVPKYRVCSACGLVRRKTALLPCAHTLCDACCHQCVQNGAHYCPLDREEFREEDVERKECPVDELLNREVRCWNEDAGCGAVMPASQLLKHIQVDCEHHRTSCPRCSMTILCGNICAHLTSGCHEAIRSDVSKGPKQSPEAPTLANLSTLFLEGVAELKADLRQVMHESRAQSQTLNEACHGINTLRETVEDKFAEAAQRSHDSFSRNRDEIGDAVKENVTECLYTPTCTLNGISENLNSLKQTLLQDVKAATEQTRDMIGANGIKIGEVQTEMRESEQKMSCRFEKVLAHVSLNAAVSYFSIAEISTRKDIVMKKGMDHVANYPVYLQGYYMSPGITLKQCADTASLHIRTQLHKGIIDDVLQWPFSRTVKLTVIHPVSGQEKEDCFKPTENDEKYYSKPTALIEDFRFVLKHSFLLRDLEREGYVKNDRLLLKYELLK
ncbi:TNF receptor-associated factor 6-like [Amblyomma americanum]